MKRAGLSNRVKLNEKEKSICLFLMKKETRYQNA